MSGGEQRAGVEVPHAGPHPTPSTGEHRIAFRGVIRTGAITLGPGDLALLDAAGGDVTATAGTPGDVVRVAYPPRLADAEALAARLDRNHPARLVAIGNGATLDVAKQAWRLGAAGPALLLAPVGDEPWRAFAPFTSLYDPDGSRVSRPDPALGDAEVLLDAAALARRPERVRHLHRADSIVHAIEVLLSRRTQEWGRALAAAGLTALGRDAPDDHLAGVVGAGLVTEAFASTGLGLAHAAASPLGAHAGRTHDAVNVLLAPHVVAYWGDRVDWRAVAGPLGTAPRADAVTTRLTDLADLAGVPRALSAAGFSWEQVRAAVPAAMRSSGMPWLPAPVDEATLTELLRRAWAGQ
ncbi:dehydroquinate synthase/iron-containing alcohol dehydrogenase family protein [Micromonospora craniellae]|uniref:iron-containing alcohol dehydrogenase n=1 Tax=Micromonospora craniellae TaxID=2294034 RepID=UPI00131468E8|nr:iron-containing alcohol dehydrogenase [Micromonospora craniellae]QOC92992.1 iron-containing alcohol dehydrogenase [Micromonospora craniellae]